MGTPSSSSALPLCKFRNIDQDKVGVEFVGGGLKPEGVELAPFDIAHPEFNFGELIDIDGALLLFAVQEGNLLVVVLPELEAALIFCVAGVFVGFKPEALGCCHHNRGCTFRQKKRLVCFLPFSSAQGIYFCDNPLPQGVFVVKKLLQLHNRSVNVVLDEDSTVSAPHHTTYLRRFAFKKVRHLKKMT
jgi:hypothetical protein